MLRAIGVAAVLLVMVLAACGGDDGGGDAQPPQVSSGNAAAGDVASPLAPTVAPVPTGTPRPPSPRSLSNPDGDPQAFEVPYSAGPFVRQTVAGSVVSPQTGGQRASYAGSGGMIVLTVYHFMTVGEATHTVEFTLGASSVESLLTDLYVAPAAAYGVARDQHGGYLAAWSRGPWAYIARTTDSRDVLDDFLGVFPY